MAGRGSIQVRNRERHAAAIERFDRVRGEGEGGVGVRERIGVVPMPQPAHGTVEAERRLHLIRRVCLGRGKLRFGMAQGGDKAEIGMAQSGDGAEMGRRWGGDRHGKEQR